MSFVFAGVVAVGLVLWQNGLEQGRLRIEEATEARRADREEMLADVAFIRETVRDGGPMMFRNMNLRGANLAGLDLGCDLESDAYGRLLPVTQEECADLTGSDFTGVDLTDTDLSGAILSDTVFRPSTVLAANMAAAHISGELDVTFRESDTRSIVLLRRDPRSHMDVGNPADTDIAFVDSLAVGATVDAASGSVTFSNTMVTGMTINETARITWPKGPEGGCFSGASSRTCSGPGRPAASGLLVMDLGADETYADEEWLGTRVPSTHVPADANARFARYWNDFEPSCVKPVGTSAGTYGPGTDHGFSAPDHPEQFTQCPF